MPKLLLITQDIDGARPTKHYTEKFETRSNLRTDDINTTNNRTIARKNDSSP